MRVLLLRVPALLLLGGLSLPARADDWSDCKYSVPEKRIAACTRLINKRDQGPEKIALAYTYRGSAYRSRDDNQSAVADFNKAIELDPKRAAYNRGLVHATRGEHDQAIAEYDEAIKANANDAPAYNARGGSLNAKGLRDRAFADWNEAIRLDPSMAVAYQNRGNAYLNKGDRELAAIDAMEAIRLDANLPVGYVLRGAVYANKGEFDRAITDYNKAIELDPKLARAFDNRGRAFVEKRDFEKAQADFDTAIALAPKFAIAYNDRGIMNGRKGEVDKAIADYSTAMEIDPKYVWAYNNRGLAYGRKGEIDKALVDFDKAVELGPQQPLVYANRGNAYEKKGDNERALADFRKVLELPAPTEADRQRQEIVRTRMARLQQPQQSQQSQQSPRAAAAPPQRVALVIGISNYANAGVLKNPANDAKATAAALRRLGFGKVIEVYDLNRDQMGKALKDFGDLVEGTEWAVVFFAGHGMEMNGATYLIPADAVLKRDTHVIDETISLTQVQAKVDAASKLGLVILDSCRNNPFADRMARSAGAARALGRGLANVEPEGNVLVAYSAKHGTTASDGSGANSPFTEALVSHIEEPGLEINFLFRKVRDDVRTKTSRRQEPFLYGSLSSEPLYFKQAANR
jgi:tetratricopeptide (TPR) repeat protein